MMSVAMKMRRPLLTTHANGRTSELRQDLVAQIDTGNLREKEASMFQQKRRRQRISREHAN